MLLYFLDSCKMKSFNILTFAGVYAPTSKKDSIISATSSDLIQKIIVVFHSYTD